jgi:DNA-binding transcriptional MerR regulator
MSTLERVMDLRTQGQTESQIIDTLKQEGVSPKEIYNALTQSNIKSELNQEPMTEQDLENTGENYSTQEPQVDTSSYPEYSQNQDMYAQPQDYNQGGYQEYQGPQPTTDIETINEIAEQIVEEKTNEIKKQISTFKNINEELKSEIERINKKIDKLESNFNELQVAIIRKVGEYGENIKNISTEVHETQNSFSKILNPLTDNIRELQKMTGGFNKPQTKEQPIQEITKTTTETITQTQEEPRKKIKPEPGFEDYLR